MSFYREGIFVLLSVLLNKPVVWNFHASRFEDFFGKYSRLKGWLLRRATLVVVLAKRYKLLLETEYKVKKVHVLRNPAILNNVEKLDYSSKNRRLKILFVGFFIPNKGILDILDLIVELDAECRYLFQFAGKGELEEEIKRLQVKFPKSIELIGWVEGEGKRQAYKEADILLLPSYREGMPIVILEAMASGLPVIATDIAAIPEQVNDGVTGLLFPPGNKERLKSCLYQFNDDEFRKSCADEAKKKVEDFALQRVFSDLVSIYKEAVK